MKKLVTISLFIFWVVVTAILVVGLFFYQNNKTNDSSNVIGNQLLGQNQTTGNINQIALNLAEVAKHNTGKDCWIIINEKVYNLTSFASQHSGGAKEILKNCGKDGTTSYKTKDGEGSHRGGDINILANYYVGDLNKTVTQQAMQKNIQNFSKEENEYEDD